MVSVRDGYVPNFAQLTRMKVVLEKACAWLLCGLPQRDWARRCLLRRHLGDALCRHPRDKPSRLVRSWRQQELDSELSGLHDAELCPIVDCLSNFVFTVRGEVGDLVYATEGNLRSRVLFVACLYDVEHCVDVVNVLDLVKLAFWLSLVGLLLLLWFRGSMNVLNWFCWNLLLRLLVPRALFFGNLL